MPDVNVRPHLIHDGCVTLSMSAASLRRWAMSSDSVSRSFSRADLYNWPTSSLCRQSFTWFTRKCITAFGTLKPVDAGGQIFQEQGTSDHSFGGDHTPVLDVFPHNQEVWFDEPLDDLTVSLLPSCQLPGYRNRLAKAKKPPKKQNDSRTYTTPARVNSQHPPHQAGSQRDSSVGWMEKGLVQQHSPLPSSTCPSSSPCLPRSAHLRGLLL